MPNSKKERHWPARLIRLSIEILAVVVILELLTGFFSFFLVTSIADPVDWRSRRLGGKYAIDCGHVPPRTEYKGATDCVLKAQADGNAFRVVYELTGIDDRYSVGIVRAPNGRVYELFYPMEIPGFGSSLLLRSVGVRPCPTPTHLFANPVGRADCFEWR
jgi:hypothetical protein